MARFPKIQNPCPLSPQALKEIEGLCGHCNKHVHDLNALDDAGREALFADATGPICVTYRLPRIAATAALAMTLAACSSTGEPLPTAGEPATPPQWVEEVTGAPMMAPEWVDIDSSQQGASSDTAREE